eukprot:SAG11_NODE_6527_length_1293_cov_2.099582_1_plen_22_part_10
MVVLAIDYTNRNYRVQLRPQLY